MHPQQIGLIVNRAPNGVLNEGTKEEIEIQGLNLLGVVPQDDWYMNMTAKEDQLLNFRKIHRFEKR